MIPGLYPDTPDRDRAAPETRRHARAYLQAEPLSRGPAPAGKALITFDNDNDADLLGYMAMEKEDPDGARAAYEVFYRRHYRWLFETIRRRHAWRLLGGAGGVADVAQATFLHAFSGAGGFDAGRLTDHDPIRRLARGWLARIAANIIKDELRRSPSVPRTATTYIEDLDPSVLAPAATEEDETERSRRLRAAIEQHPERDQDILWT